MDPVALTISGAILGAILGVAFTEIRIKIKGWWELRNQDKWKGIWYCAWQDESITKNSWIIDKVKLQTCFNKLHIKIVKKGGRYDWKAIAEKKDNYLIASWNSVRPNSQAFGAFMVRISAQGEFWCGFQIGPAKRTKIVCGKVIIANSMENIEKAKNEFNQHI